MKNSLVFKKEKKKYSEKRMTRKFFFFFLPETLACGIWCLISNQMPCPLPLAWCQGKREERKEKFKKFEILSQKS